MTKQLITNRLSVIVPCYNVQQYLVECLDSLRNQTYDNLEVIMVDDGSTDKTGQIIDDYAKKFNNFRAVHTVNGGLSAARNAGLPLIQGEFLAFIDSDDYLPINAYQLLVESMIKNKADIATGQVERFNSSRRYPSKLHQKAVKKTILGTNLANNPELVYDTTAWNKVYRSSIFLREQLQFPVGLTYEDIPVTLHYYLLANKINIINKVTYYWRSREGKQKSITQQRSNLKMFRDRLKTLSMAWKSLNELSDNDTLKDIFTYKVLSFDIPMYLNSFYNVDKHTLKLFFVELRNGLKTYDLTILSKLSKRKQMEYKLVLQNNFEVFWLFMLSKRIRLGIKSIFNKGN